MKNISFSIFKACLIIISMMVFPAQAKDEPDVLPDYVVSNDDSQPEELRAILRKKAKPVYLPMSDEDKQIVNMLEAKFDQADRMVGLSAPQIGFSKRIIVFGVDEKYCHDDVKPYPKTTWLNPSYQYAGHGQTSLDYEACFSIKDTVALVKRYNKIQYEAWLPNGERVTGRVDGYVARVIQHEIDHLKGVLFTDIAEPDSIMTMDEYRAMVKKKASS